MNSNRHSSVFFQKIEQKLLVLLLIIIALGYYFSGMEGGIGALLGGFVGYANFKLIQLGVSWFLNENIRRSQQKYIFFSATKFVVLSIFLGLIFYWVKPSVIFFLIGFSLLFPVILWETIFHFNRSDEIGETISGS